MASLNRAAWLPSKVTKLRSGKIEHRPGMGQGTVKTNRCFQGEGCLGTQSRCPGLFLSDSQALGAGRPHRAGVIQRSEVIRVRNLPRQDHTETRGPTGGSIQFRVKPMLGAEGMQGQGYKEDMAGSRGPRTHRGTPRRDNSGPRLLSLRGPGLHSEEVQHPGDSAETGSRGSAGPPGRCGGRSPPPGLAGAQGGGTA